MENCKLRNKKCPIAGTKFKCMKASFNKCLMTNNTQDRANSFNKCLMTNTPKIEVKIIKIPQSKIRSYISISNYNKTLDCFVDHLS